MEKIMKKIILIALSLMLAIGILSTFVILASASGSNERNLPEVSENLGRVTADASDLGLDYYAIWNAFVEEIDTSYKNGNFYFADDNFTNATFFSYLNYETYQLTLIDGKWQTELPADVGQRGGMVYAYDGQWRVLYRGGTKESVYLDGENEFGNPYLVEIMSHIFKIWTVRYIGEETITIDAYYKFDGELDYLYVSKWMDGDQVAVYFNAEREATMAYDGSNYMMPDGNWYSDTTIESDPCEPCERFAGMSFEEVTSLVPCALYCGDHQLTEYSCDLGQYCTVCFETTKAQSYHDYAEATCTAPSTCKKCGNTVGERIDHGYDATDFAPDCENEGYTLYTCRTCGDNYTADAIDAFGHAYDATVTNPTCTDGGYTTYVCCNCGDDYVSDEVGPLGHDWTDATYDAPKTCDECGETEGEPLERTEKSTEESATEPEQNTEIDTEEKSETESVGKPNEESATESATESELESESDKAQASDSDDTRATSGCGSTVGIGATAIILAIGVFGLVFMGKKKENE